MSSQIERLACALSETSNEVKRSERDYRDAIATHKDMKEKLTSALYEKNVLEPIAIELDDDDVLICLWDGENSYDFSIIRRYN